MKACIFDLDGTLTDTLSSIAFYGNSALNAYGLPAIDTEEYKYFLGDGRDSLIHRMLDYHNADNNELFKNVAAEYDRQYESDVICMTKPFPGVVELLGNLKNSGVRLAVLSNKPDNVACSVVAALFGGIFDFVSGEKKDVKRKPDPSGAMLAASCMGVDVRDCFFIGDTNVDIFTGKACDMRTIGVLWGFRDLAELTAAGADYIARSAEDIYRFVIGE